MSFGVSDAASGLEYNATTLNRLFCQRRNLLNPHFYGMVSDIIRFYRQAPALLDEIDADVTLSDWLAGSGLGRMFADYHLMPMASALWSAPDGADRRVPDAPLARVHGQPRHVDAGTASALADGDRRQPGLC
jgi:uncharacterized protein